MTSSIGTNYGVLLDKNSFSDRYFGKIEEFFRYVARDQACDDLLLQQSVEFLNNEILIENGLIENFLKARETEFALSGQSLSFRPYLLNAILNAWKRHFCTIYHEQIRQAFEITTRGQADEHLLNDLSQEFLIVKIMQTNGVIEGYLRKLDKAKPDDEKTPFLAYLKKAVHHYWQSHLRRKIDLPQARDPDKDPVLSLAAAADLPDKIDPEVLYAYALLNRTLNQVRAYCQVKKNERNWIIFDELVLAQLDEDRQPRTREDLRTTYFPRDHSNQKLDNALTTVKRIFDRHLREQFAEFDAFDKTPRERFDLWLEDLRGSNSFIHGAIQQAIRVSPETYQPLPGASKTVMMQPTFLSEQEESQLGFAFYLRKALPVMEWPEWPFNEGVQKLIPKISLCRPGQGKSGVRRLTLEMLMAPSDQEKRELQQLDMEQILTQVKNLAKGIHLHPKTKPVDKELFRAMHTVLITIARVGFGHNITSRSMGEQQNAIRELKSARWLDDETIAWLNQALLARGVWFKG